MKYEVVINKKTIIICTSTIPFGSKYKFPITDTQYLRAERACFPCNTKDVRFDNLKKKLDVSLHLIPCKAVNRTGFHEYLFS